jgi:lipid-A-disaccharide synthase
MKGLKSMDEHAEFCYWGGEMMESVSPGLKKHYRDLAFMGFAEVIKNIRTINKFFAECKKEIKAFQPDAIIFIDYPGFNLRMAKWAKKHGFLNFYFISPQVWAWKSKRVETIRKYIDKMFVILPFEKDFYAQRGIDVSYYGHPLVEQVDQYRAGREQLSTSNTIALLPGSRKQEISRILPLMVSACKEISHYQFSIAKATAIPADFYLQFIGDEKRFQIHEQGSYDLLSKSYAALVTSGTATLETALFGIPQVVCYKGSSVSYRIAKSLVKIEYISLVNLIAGKEVVKELIQHECNPQRIQEELLLLTRGGQREKILAGYNNIRNELNRSGDEPVAYEVAREISAYLLDSRA